MKIISNFTAKLYESFNNAKTAVTGSIKKGEVFTPSFAAHAAGLLSEAFAPGLYNIVALPMAAAGKVLQNADYALSSRKHFNEVAMIGIGEFLNVRTLLILGTGAALTVAASGCLSDVRVEGDNNTIGGTIKGSNITFAGDVLVQKGAVISCDDSYFKDCIINSDARLYGTGLKVVGGVIGAPNNNYFSEAYVSCLNTSFENCVIHNGADIECDESRFVRSSVTGEVNGRDSEFIDSIIQKNSRVNTGWAIKPTIMQNTSFGENSACQSGNYFDQCEIKKDVNIADYNHMVNVTAENDSSVGSNNDLKDGIIKSGANVGSKWASRGIKAINFVFK